MCNIEDDMVVPLNTDVTHIPIMTDTINDHKRSISQEPETEEHTEVSEHKRPKLDQESQKRSQRLFGVLLGTLSKFKETSATKTDAELKREAINQKLAEKLRKEKEELKEKAEEDKKQRQLKIQEQHRKQLVEFSLGMMDTWANVRVDGYLQTRQDPEIFFKPAKMTAKHEEWSQSTREKLAIAYEQEDALIAKKKKELDNVEIPLDNVEEQV